MKKKQGYLLFDETTVLQKDNCIQRFFQAVKDPMNPIVRKTEEWEGACIYTAGTSILWAPEEACYRMNYCGHIPSKCTYSGGYLQSKDGLTWEKPANFSGTYEGKPVTYSQVIESWTGETHMSVIYDPRPECPADERFKGMSWMNRIGTVNEDKHVFFSADGKTWKPYSGNPVWRACSDMIFCTWDEKIQKFVCYFKLWKIIGQERDISAPFGFRSFSTLCLTWENEELDNGLTRIYGDYFVTLHPEKAAEVVSGEFFLKSGNYSGNDGGGGHLIGDWRTKRVVCRAVSDDFIHWEQEQVVLEVDELDRPDANIQGATVFSMGGYYIAIFPLHDDRGHFDQQVAFSCDGIHWKRPWRGNFIGHGAPGQFDHGMVSNPSDPIIVENQMIFYYGGMTSGHDKEECDGISIGRAILRRDGFACWQAGSETATLQTVAFPVQQVGLYLNVDAEGGWVTAALLDESGNIIPGYSHENCEIITEDSASYTECNIPVTWKGQDRLPVGKVSVQLNFENASIYSVLI